MRAVAKKFASLPARRPTAGHGGRPERLVGQMTGARRFTSGMLTGLQRQVGNGAVAGLVASIPGRLVVQRDEGKDKLIREGKEKVQRVHPYWMRRLLPELGNVPKEVLTDEAYGRSVGGERLVAAMRAALAKTNHESGETFFKSQKGFLEGIKLPLDQVYEIVTYLGDPNLFFLLAELIPNWPKLYDDKQLSEGMWVEMTTRMLANRAALPIRSDLREERGGFKYAGVPAALQDPTAARLERIVRAEISTIEGGPGAVNTTDANPLTLGAGFAGPNMITWMGNWLSADKGAEATFRGVGVDVTPARFRAVQGPGVLVEGAAAQKVMATSKALLSAFMNAAEAAGSASKSVEAQVVQLKTLHLVDAAKTANKTPSWSEAAIAVCVHIQHWLSAHGWGSHKDEYLATKGDILQIVKTFGRLAGKSLANGAIVAGNGVDAHPFAGDHFDRFGAGVGAAGIAKRTAEAVRVPVTASVNEIAGDSGNAGMLFFRIGTPTTDPAARVDWWKLPAR